MIAQSLVKKWEEASVGFIETKLALHGLTERLDEDWINTWKAAEAEAIEHRGEKLRIYDVQLENGQCPYQFDF